MSRKFYSPHFNRINGRTLCWVGSILIIVLVSLMVIAPQMINHQIIVGEDCWFHMNRAYEDMMQIKTGHFSYFMSLFSFESSGRIVNGMYGPFGGYLEGLLLLIVKSWYRWEIVNDLIVLVTAGFSMMYVAHRLKSGLWISLLVGIFYMTSFPFDRWVLGQNFDGFGAILLPWFLLVGYRIFQHRFSVIKLALLVAVTAQFHLMSTFVGIISLLLSFVLANCYSGRLTVWIKCLEAAGLSLLLTINVWGVLLEVKGSNYLVPTYPYNTFLSTKHAINWGLLETPVVNHVITELIIFLVIGVLLAVFWNVGLEAKFFTIQSLGFIWLISKYFPWSSLINHYSMITSYIQFPERFLPLAIASILLLIAQVRPKYLMMILVLLAVVINCEFDAQNDFNKASNQYHELMRTSWNVNLNGHPSYQTVESDLTSNHPGRFLQIASNRVPDYMPLTVGINQAWQYKQMHPDKLNKRDVINNPLPVNRIIKDRDVEELIFNAQPGRKVKLPFVKYAHTKLWLNHRMINPKLNQLATIDLRSHQLHNVLGAQYQPSRWYEALAGVEVVAWLSLMGWLIFVKVRRL